MAMVKIKTQNGHAKGQNYVQESLQVPKFGLEQVTDDEPTKNPFGFGWLAPKISWKDQRLRRVVVIGAAISAAFVLLNLTVYIAYLHRSYPNTTVANKQVGSLAQKQLEKRLGTLELLPSELRLKYRGKSTVLKPSELGLQLNVAKTTQQVIIQRQRLPIFNFVSAHHIPLYTQINSNAFKAGADKLASIFKKDAVNAKISLSNGVFALDSESNGYALDSTSLRNILESMPSRGGIVTVPVQTTTPAVHQADLNTNLQDLQSQQQVVLTYRYQENSKRLSTTEISSLYVPSGNSYALSDERISSFLASVGSGFGIKVQNLSPGLAATKDALQNKKSLDFTLVPMPAAHKAFTYCVATRNVDTSFVPELENKLAAVYSDARGWSLGSQVSFSQATSNCNLTVWLSSADSMASFGSVCDADWSCTVSPNVIINFDRWRYGSTAWNQGGGNLEDYRTMVINHETGHWLGFNHRYCAGPGQLAPVMQQQSIDLQGCKFNPWPTPAELDTLKSTLQL